MTFIGTVPTDAAGGEAAAMYEEDRTARGEVMNLTRAFSLRPDVFRAWQTLAAAVRTTMDLRRYELATIAAARRLRSSYCVLAHGSLIADTLMEPELVRAIVSDHHTAGLDDVDVAIMDLADKIADDATTVTQADVDRLRALGLSDPEIFDIVSTAALRCFFSTMLDGLGVEPDARYADLEPGLRDTLTVGRPIADR
jgi:uncharacterized peroxidase-related enzyme